MALLADMAQKASIGFGCAVYPHPLHSLGDTKAPAIDLETCDKDNKDSKEPVTTRTASVKLKRGSQVTPLAS